MPEISVARTITVVTLPEKSQEFIREALEAESIEKRREGLDRAFNGEFFGEQGARMEEVRALVRTPILDNQVELLLCALDHAMDGQLGHSASLHFLQLASEYQLDGVGLEIRDDTVTEEKLFGPVRVMFVTWQTSES